MNREPLANAITEEKVVFLKSGKEPIKASQNRGRAFVLKGLPQLEEDVSVLGTFPWTSIGLHEFPIDPINDGCDGGVSDRRLMRNRLDFGGNRGHLLDLELCRRRFAIGQKRIWRRNLGSFLI